MSNSILRIICSSTSELPFVKMSILEADGNVDQIILCEANRTHTGIPHEPEFEAHSADLKALAMSSTFTYAFLDISDESRAGVCASDHHFNEWLIRDASYSHGLIEPDDVVIAVDADEVLYAQSYRRVLDAVANRRFFKNSVRLPMHQFYYRVNLLWEDMVFQSAVAGGAGVLHRRRVGWRDHGRSLGEVVGCHFSWQLTTEQMIAKLQTYSHSTDYGHLASAEILEAAVRDRTYPFDPSRPFRLRRIDSAEYARYYPGSIDFVWPEVHHLVDW